MSSRVGINIFARLQMQHTAAVREEVKGIQLSLDNISDSFAQIPAKEKQLRNTFGTAINAVSSLQLLRFAMVDISQIASGKGGIGDILSLTTTSIILIYRVNQLLRAQIVLQTALNAARAVGLALGGISPVTLAAAGAGALIIGVPAIMDYFTERGRQERRIQGEVAAQRLGFSIYPVRPNQGTSLSRELATSVNLQERIVARSQGMEP